MPVGNESYLDYEPIPADNSKPSPLGAAEGAYQGRWVNDTSRTMMAIIRRLGDGVIHRDGTTKPTADIDWNNKRILNLAFGTARSQAAAVGQIQDGRAAWGGVSGGTGAAYVLAMTPEFTPTIYQPGFTIHFIAHAANTVTNPSLKVDSGPAIGMRHRNADSLRVSDLVSNVGYTARFDGTFFRMLDAGGYMEQNTYNCIYPVGATLPFGNLQDPNLVLPRGVVATWILELAEGLYVRGTTGSPIAGGGSFNSIPPAAHPHPAGSLTVSRTTTRIGGIDIGPGEPLQVVTDVSTTLTGSTGAADPGAHTVIPPFVTYRLWRRTS